MCLICGLQAGMFEKVNGRLAVDVLQTQTIPAIDETAIPRMVQAYAEFALASAAVLRMNTDSLMSQDEFRRFISETATIDRTKKKSNVSEILTDILSQGCGKQSTFNKEASKPETVSGENYARAGDEQVKKSEAESSGEDAEPTPSFETRETTLEDSTLPEEIKRLFRGIQKDAEENFSEVNIRVVELSESPESIFDRMKRGYLQRLNEWIHD